MKPEQLRDLVRYRMEQARETLAEAAILRDAGAFRGAVSRSYYAMFYTLLGLLATRQLGASKHTGAIALFDREFVKTGIFPPELSQGPAGWRRPGRRQRRLRRHRRAGAGHPVDAGAGVARAAGERAAGRQVGGSPD